MATQIGIVKALIGTATATAADGTIRNLQIGDQVFADELITTGAGGAIELEFADGSVMDLGRNSQAVLDDTVFNPEAATAVAETTDAEVDAIQAALLAGADPTQIGEATAAGAGVAGEGNEGHQPVVVDYLAPEAPVESGFDTTGIGVLFPEIQEELQTPIEDEPVIPSPVNEPPSINPEGANDVVYEAGLTNGSGVGSTTTTVEGSFTVSDPDGLDDITSVTINGTTIATADLGSNNTVAGSHGTLTVTGYNSATGVATYSYTLESPTTDIANAVESDVFTLTTTDGTATSAEASITIEIVDDGPQAFLSVDSENDISIEETGGTAIITFNLVGTFNPGADGLNPVNGEKYSIRLLAENGVDSGLQTTAQDTIYLFQTGDDTIIGSTNDEYQGDDDSVVFRITIDVTGGIIKVESQGFFHPPEEPVIFLDTGIEAVYTVTDGDGDTSEATVSLSQNIGFVDGVPMLGAFASIILANEADVTTSGQVLLEGNADGIADINITPTNLPADWASSSVENFVDGEFVSRTLTIANADGATYGSLTIDASGNYSFKLITPTPIDFLTATLTDPTAGGPVPEVVLPIVGSDGETVLTATFSSESGGINSSTQGMGVNNNSVDNPTDNGNNVNPPEVVSIAFDENLSDIGFTVNNLRNTGSNQVETLTWSVFTLTTTTVDGEEVSTKTLVDSGTVTPPLGTGESTTFGFVLSDYGLDEGVEFNHVELAGEDGTDYRLLSMSVQTTNPPEEVSLNFNVTVEDGDGDITDPQVLNVGVTGGEGSGYNLVGDDGNNILQGGSGDDILTGGLGDDILTGGAGDDVFAWNASDADGGIDTITDFDINNANGLGNDVLNLADLLDPTGALNIGVTDNLDNYLKATFDNVSNTTTIDVYTAGDANAAGTIDQSIVINGDVSDLNSLLAANNLIVDQ
ncbi:MAG: retention module-containing protein [Gammaproteobacteria bacterium]|nr:retention module-containing protein [Gammaproteobacteria bacterium]